MITIIIENSSAWGLMMTPPRIHLALTARAVFVFLATLASASAEVIEQRWATRTNGTANGDDSHHGVALDAAGNVFSCGALFNTGTSRDFHVAKYDKTTGAVLWTFTKRGSRADGP